MSDDAAEGEACLDDIFQGGLGWKTHRNPISGVEPLWTSQD